MLGELIYEATGKMTGTRVLDENGTIENSLQEFGTIVGIACNATLTMVGTPRPDGTVFSKGSGILLTDKGDAATLTSSSISIPKGPMPVSSVRGATFFHSQSPKLTRLNSVVCVYEVEVAADGSYSVKEWEWE